jgi:hypothetical protein
MPAQRHDVQRLKRGSGRNEATHGSREVVAIMSVASVEIIEAIRLAELATLGCQLLAEGMLRKRSQPAV